MERYSHETTGRAPETGKHTSFTNLLLNNGAHNNILDKVVNKTELENKVRERQELIKELENIYSKIPPLTSIEDALEKNLLELEEAETFYHSLMDLVTKDKESKRILLYFPIELVPNETRKEFAFFNDFYKSTWKELLNDIDIREDFSEGDIVEETSRNSPLERVSKAAHLIPSLVEKHVISIEEVLYILENEKNETITYSVLDTLRILADKKYLTEQHIQQLEKSPNVSITNAMILLRYDQKAERTEQKEAIKNQDIQGQKDTLHKMNTELDSVEKVILNKKNVSSQRTAWLRKMEKERIIERYAQIISDNFPHIDQLKNILADQNLTETHILSIIQSIEKKILRSEDKKTYMDMIRELALHKSVAVQNQISNTLYRLQSANITDLLNDAEIVQREQNLEKETRVQIEKLLFEIKNNPVLAESVYQAVILYGSHIKGYGKEKADLDMAIFVKENIDFSYRKEITNSFAVLLNKSQINGSIMEFWLKKENDTLVIQDFENPDANLGDSFITAPIIGSWYGDKEVVSNLQKELLPNYLYSENKKVGGIDMRKIWLRNMEHNLIQYRLMHRGYEERNVTKGGIDSIYKNEIDGESMFYDSGFRRLATRIYLEKIFLPELKKEV